MLVYLIITLGQILKTEVDWIQGFFGETQKHHPQAQAHP